MKINYTLALLIALFPASAIAQNFGPSVTYTQHDGRNLYCVGISTSDRGRVATWSTTWNAVISDKKLSGLYAAIGPRYHIGGFNIGASGVLLLPVFERTEGPKQTTRIFAAPSLGVTSGSAQIELAYLIQVSPKDRGAHAIQARVSYLIGKQKNPRRD